MNGLNLFETTDFQFHDTYLVFMNYHFLLLILILVFFWIYLIKALQSHFKNTTTNITLMTSTVFTIIVFYLFNSGFESLINEIHSETEKISGWTVNPPVITKEITKQLETGINTKLSRMQTSSHVFFYGLQFVLITLLVFCGFKTIQNFK